MPKDDFWKDYFTTEDRYAVFGIQSLTLDFLKKKNGKNPRILDVGCSSGIAFKSLKIFLTKNGYRPYAEGIDINEKVIKKARKTGFLTRQY